MSRRGKPGYRRILGVLVPFRPPCRGKGGVSVELSVEHLATIFRDWQSCVTSTESVRTPNPAVYCRRDMDVRELHQSTPGTGWR